MQGGYLWMVWWLRSGGLRACLALLGQGGSLPCIKCMGLGDGVCRRERGTASGRSDHQGTVAHVREPQKSRANGCKKLIWLCWTGVRHKLVACATWCWSNAWWLTRGRLPAHARASPAYSSRVLLRPFGSGLKGLKRVREGSGWGSGHSKLKHINILKVFLTWIIIGESKDRK